MSSTAHWEGVTWVPGHYRHRPTPTHHSVEAGAIRQLTDHNWVYIVGSSPGPGLWVDGTLKCHANSSDPSRDREYMYVAEVHILRGNPTKNNVSIYSMVRHVHLKLLMDE